MKKMILVLSAICILTPALASAKMANMQAFKAAYPATKLTVNCKVCHEKAPPKLNYYGQDVQKANSDFKAIEALDSDGDGFTNIDEITKGSHPGDKTSVPAVTDPAAPAEQAE